MLIRQAHSETQLGNHPTCHQQSVAGSPLHHELGFGLTKVHVNTKYGSHQCSATARAVSDATHSQVRLAMQLSRHVPAGTHHAVSPCRRVPLHHTECHAMDQPWDTCVALTANKPTATRSESRSTLAPSELTVFGDLLTALSHELFFALNVFTL